LLSTTGSDTLSLSVPSLSTLSVWWVTDSSTVSQSINWNADGTTHTLTLSVTTANTNVSWTDFQIHELADDGTSRQSGSINPSISFGTTGAKGSSITRTWSDRGATPRLGIRCTFTNSGHGGQAFSLGFSLSSLSTPIGPEVLGSVVKYWTGINWAEKPLKVFNGATWDYSTLKRWNGSEWVNE
jgi:hypothetical protein